MLEELSDAKGQETSLYLLSDRILHLLQLLWRVPHCAGLTKNIQLQRELGE